MVFVRVHYPLDERNVRVLGCGNDASHSDIYEHVIVPLMDGEYLPAHLHGQPAQVGRAHRFSHEVTALHLDEFKVEGRKRLQCDAVHCI